MRGPLMIGLEGTDLQPSDIDRLKQPVVGGVLLLAHNYIDQQQLKTLTQAIRATHPQILIAVDQEGGKVQRLQEGFTRLPAMAAIGDLYNTDQAAARQWVRDCASVIAYELQAMGITLSFAPVLDLDCGSAIIGDRSFSSDSDVVIDLASHFIDQLASHNMLAVGKHFPGHGSVLEDTHKEMVYDARALSQIQQEDMRTFEYLIAQGQLDCLMTSHIIYSAVDETPASLSAQWIRDILRSQLGFEGIVFSDDLGMTGSGMPDAQRLSVALEAGCDVLIAASSIACSNRAIEDLDNIDWMPCAEDSKTRWHKVWDRLTARHQQGSSDVAHYEAAVERIQQRVSH